MTLSATGVGLAQEGDARREFIEKRFAACWRTRWHGVDRDQGGMPRRFVALSNSELAKIAAGLPVAIPKGLFG
jgi:hypothetical protein